MPEFVGPWGKPVAGPFLSASLRTGLATCHRIRLSGWSGSEPGRSFGAMDPRRSPGVDRIVAFLADHQGLAPSGGHDLDPGRAFSSALDLEVCQLPYVVDRDVRRRPTEFTFIRQESLDQLRAREVTSVLVGEDVVDLRERLGLEGDAAEHGDERWLVPSLNDHTIASHLPVVGDGYGSVLPGHLGYGGFVLACEGLEHGKLHDPSQAVQPMAIVRICIILCISPELLPV